VTVLAFIAVSVLGRPRVRGLGALAIGLGFPFGGVPAGGAEIPAFLSYVLERRPSRRKAAPSPAGCGR
jgi:TctA family transporter